MTLRQLWLMKAGRAEERRWLALDVCRLLTATKCDVENYLQRGQLDEIRSDYPVPRTEMFRSAEESAGQAAKDGRPWDITAWVRSQQDSRN